MDWLRGMPTVDWPTVRADQRLDGLAHLLGHRVRDDEREDPVHPLGRRLGGDGVDRVARRQVVEHSAVDEVRRPDHPVGGECGRVPRFEEPLRDCARLEGARERCRGPAGAGDPLRRQGVAR